MISKTEYGRLLERDEWLSCLESAGVDNWDGYDYAKEFLNSVDEDDLMDDTQAESEIDPKELERQRIAEETERIRQENKDKFRMNKREIIDRVGKKLKISKGNNFSKMDMIHEYLNIVISDGLESIEFVEFWRNELNIANNPECGK